MERRVRPDVGQIDGARQVRWKVEGSTTGTPRFRREWWRVSPPAFWKRRRALLVLAPVLGRSSLQTVAVRRARIRSPPCGPPSAFCALGPARSDRSSCITLTCRRTTSARCSRCWRAARTAMLRTDANAFSSAIGRSFYPERSAGQTTLDLAWSSYAAQWLSQVPRRIPKSLLHSVQLPVTCAPRSIARLLQIGRSSYPYGVSSCALEAGWWLHFLPLLRTDQRRLQ